MCCSSVWQWMMAQMKTFRPKQAPVSAVTSYCTVCVLCAQERRERSTLYLIWFVFVLCSAWWVVWGSRSRLPQLPQALPFLKKIMGGDLLHGNMSVMHKHLYTLTHICVHTYLPLCAMFNSVILDLDAWMQKVFIAGLPLLFFFKMDNFENDWCQHRLLSLFQLFIHLISTLVRHFFTDSTIFESRVAHSLILYNPTSCTLSKYVCGFYIYQQ